MMNRREFLKLVAGAGLTAPALLGSSGCATVAPPEFADTGLSLYCVTGDVTDKNALVWLRAQPDSLVTVQYGKDPGLTDYAARSEEHTSELQSRLHLVCRLLLEK